MNAETRLPVLFLLPDLSPHGQAARGRMLAELLPGDRFRIAVGVLGPIDPSHAADLKDAGIAIAAAPIRHSMDVSGVGRLRRFAREFGPSIVHAWGCGAVRAARCLLAGDRDGGNLPRFVVSASAESPGGWAGWRSARQLRRADRVIPTTRADGERYRRRGVPVERLTLISPSAAMLDGEIDRAAFSRGHNLPPGARLLVAGGESIKGVGPKDSIVAFDMLRYDAKDLHLMVCGAGEETAALEQFGRALAFDDFRLRFAPAGAVRSGAVQFADAVLVTNPRGVDEALEAMAAGRPVIGWQTPDLEEIVDDKVTGVLVPLGDRGALAATTRAVLANPNYARRLGEAGRTRVADRFGRARMVDQFARLYSELVGP